MKIIYVLIVIAILVGGLTLLSQLLIERSPAPSTPESTSQEESDTSPGTETSSEDTVQTPGSDVGMEMPIPDAGVDIEIDQDAKVFDVSGTNYAFDVTEIRVQEGDTVTINFSSADGFHDWVIDEFDAQTERVRPGTVTSVTFVANKKGAFEYYCSVGSHRANGMVGTLIVE